MLKLMLSASVVLSPVSPAVSIDPAPIPKIVCRVDHGYVAGTAFRIGPTLLLTARHVISHGTCQMDGRPVHVAYASDKADFAIISDESEDRWIKADCAGYVPGRLYLAIGHARAMDELTVVPVVATGAQAFGKAVLAGVFTAQPGQSGGPIIDAESGSVVGIVNTGDWEQGLTGSIELKTTPICGGTDA